MLCVVCFCDLTKATIVDSRMKQITISHMQNWYRIAGNFRRRKLLQIGEKYDFRGENFHRLLAESFIQFLRQKSLTTPIPSKENITPPK